MNLVSYQRDPKPSRFSCSNDIWKRELKPQGFALLAYLCYLHVHCKKDVLPSADEIVSQLHMSKDMATEWIAELNHRGLLDNTWFLHSKTPAKIFSLCPMNFSS